MKLQSVASILPVAALALASLSFTACSKGGDSKPQVAVSDAAKKEADEIWKGRCVTCHGEQGDGNGPAGAMLNPKPRNFTDAAWHKTVDDAQVAKAIVEGGAAVGKSALMTPNPDLKDKKEVVDALVIKLRGMAK